MQVSLYKVVLGRRLMKGRGLVQRIEGSNVCGNPVGLQTELRKGLARNWPECVAVSMLRARSRTISLSSILRNPWATFPPLSNSWDLCSNCIQIQAECDERPADQILLL